LSSPPLSPVWSGRALEAVHALDWSEDGQRLLVTPAEGFLFEVNPVEKKILREFAGTIPGNGAGSYLPNGTVVVPGCNGSLQLHPSNSPDSPPKLSLGRGWIEKIYPAPDGQSFAVALGRLLQVYSCLGELLWEVQTPKGVQDLAWNPQNSTELVVAGDGGVWCYQVGQPEPQTVLAWSGACWRVLWSADQRWVITSDQTPSVHLIDLPRNFPLHIQGYESKIACLALDHSSRWLATGAAGKITIWDCFGPKGPEGSVPRQLEAHEEEDEQPQALAYAPGTTLLASGGTQGCLLLFDPTLSPDPLCRARAESPWTCLAWNRTGDLLAGGTESGALYVFRRN
jgi:hypothetical protein